LAPGWGGVGRVKGLGGRRTRIGSPLELNRCNPRNPHYQRETEDADCEIVRV